MSEKRNTRHHFILANIILATIITLAWVPFLTPWQLFQLLCPYLNAQSPQCNLLQQQLQQQQQQQPFLSQPYQQQPYPQQQLCPDGSLPDVNGNCQSIQPQQPSASSLFIPGSPSSSTSPFSSLPGFPSSSSSAAPSPSP
jgi:hypothetical protein